MEDAGSSREIQKVREWYDDVAYSFIKRYEGFEGDYWKKFEEDRILKAIDVKNKTVLDLGCGHGRITFELAKNAKKVIGLDISEKLVAVARKRQKKCKIRNAIFIVGDAAKLPKFGNQFDMVIALGMFEYMQNPAIFLGNIRRVLKKNGILVFTFHLNLPLVDKIAKKNYKGKLSRRKWLKVWHTKNGIIEIVQSNGFKPYKIESFGHVLPTAMFRILKMRNFAPALDRIMGTLPLVKYFPSHGIMFCRKRQSANQ